MTHQDKDTQVLKKENHPKMLKKGATKVRTPNLLVIIVVRKDMILMCVGARLQIRILIIRACFTIISATNKVIKHMNEELRLCTLKYFKAIVITIRSMDIEILSANPNPCGHQKNKQR